MYLLYIGVTNVKLQLDAGTTLYGELTIGDFIVSEANRLGFGADQRKQLTRITSDI
jgi:hypothetical protein